jgi:hypothetical protein
MAKTHADKNPKTKPGVTGFVQDYNEEPGPTSDLNPDVVTEDSVLPEPRKAEATRGGKRSTAVAAMSTERGGKAIAKPRARKAAK